MARNLLVISGTLTLEGKMPALSNEKAVRTIDLFLAPLGSAPPTHGFHLAGGRSSQTESQPPQLPSNWEKQENSEHHDIEEDAQLHELMEDVKRYIRSIDISNL